MSITITVRDPWTPFRGSDDSEPRKGTAVTISNAPDYETAWSVGQFSQF